MCKPFAGTKTTFWVDGGLVVRTIYASGTDLEELVMHYQDRSLVRKTLTEGDLEEASSLASICN